MQSCRSVPQPVKSSVQMGWADSPQRHRATEKRISLLLQLVIAERKNLILPPTGASEHLHVLKFPSLWLCVSAVQRMVWELKPNRDEPDIR